MMTHFRIIRITDGMPVGIIESVSARGAIMKAHKVFGYDSFNRAYPATLEDVEDYNSGVALAMWRERMREARQAIRRSWNVDRIRNA